jgi:hypothetical protein
MKRKIEFYWNWSNHNDEMFIFTIIPTIMIIRLGNTSITFEWLCLTLGLRISDKDIKK